MEMDKKPLYRANAPVLSRPSLLLAMGFTSPAQPALFDAPHAPLRYVIKRHRATSLHTDYRFEVGDTLFSLVSWGHPTLNPRRPLRLREMSDHDPAYLMGERRIPGGAYGAGPMVVWDFGTYAPVLPFEGSPSEAVLMALLAGAFDLRLTGRRLNGAFRLEVDQKDWSFRKLEDEDASFEPFEWDDRSALTGRSLDDIERDYQASVRRLRGH